MLRVVLERLNGAVRALVLGDVYQSMHRDPANAIGHLHRMLLVVRKFAVMRHTELVSQSGARNVIALSERIVVILVLLIWGIAMKLFS